MPAKRKAATKKELFEHARKLREQALAERGPRPARDPGKWAIIDVGPGPSWVTWGFLVIRQGRVVVREMRILRLGPRDEADMPASGLTTHHLRAIHFGAFPWPELSQEARERLGVTGTVRARGRTRYQRETDDFYAEKANEYLLALTHDRRRPRVWLAEEYRRRGDPTGSTAERIRDWIVQARRRGFLTPADHGRPGAEPTDKLRAWNRAQRRKEKR